MLIKTQFAGTTYFTFRKIKKQIVSKNCRAHKWTIVYKILT